MNRPKRIYKPNATQCEGCPDWDDINGCWANIKNVDNCTNLNEEGYYPFGEEDNDEDEYPEEDISCGCKICICPCSVETEGEICTACLSHNHQG